MDCWECGERAAGMCRFCGRAVCRKHAKPRPFVLATLPGALQDVVRALVVDDALSCGLCHPRPSPVEVPLG